MPFLFDGEDRHTDKNRWRRKGERKKCDWRLNRESPKPSSRPGLSKSLLSAPGTAASSVNRSSILPCARSALASLVWTLLAVLVCSNPIHLLHLVSIPPPPARPFLAASAIRGHCLKAGHPWAVLFRSRFYCIAPSSSPTTHMGVHRRAGVLSALTVQLPRQRRRTTTPK